MHGHELFSGADERVSVVLRDGRDLMVSFYYHHLFYNEWNHHPSVDRQRAHLGFKDFDDIRRNLPNFIEYVNCVWGKRWNHFTWAEFVESWLDNVPDSHIVKYEDLLVNPLETMERALKAVGETEIDMVRLSEIVDKYRFEKLAGRKAGQENKSSFVRKGVSGDWVNYFTREAREVFDQYAGDALIRCGYETSHRWVND
jgi:hypothetical protein